MQYSRRVSGLAGTVAFAAAAAGLAVPATSASAAAPAAAPSAVSAALSTRITLLGTYLIIPQNARSSLAATVTGPVGRRVTLQRYISGAWRTIAVSKTGSTRKVVFRLTTNAVGPYDVRVYAPAIGTWKAALSSRVLVNVGKGVKTDYVFMKASTGYGARWNPCQVINWRINLSGAYTGALTDATIAVQRVARATGLRYSYKGTTSVLPGATSSVISPYPAGTRLVIAYSNPGRSRYLPSGSTASGVLAVGGWATTLTTPRKFRTGTFYQITQGFVVVNRQQNLARGYGAGGTWGAVMQHEMGHTVGIGHAKGSAQLMYPYLTYGVPNWGVGDLTGLRILGVGSGCFSSSSGLTKASVPAKPIESVLN